MRHLEEVLVDSCKRLKTVFPASVAKDLETLGNLKVEDCEGLMTIVAEDNTDPRETNVEVTFPCYCVRSLKLRGLPKLKYFYYYTHLELEIEKCMSVGENGMKMILGGEFERKLLDNLKTLTLYFGSDVFGCKILEQVPNIEKLVVCDGSFKKMFCCESGNNVLKQLKVLRLESLGELVSIGLENSWTDSFVRNLEIFEVINCSSLKNLVGCTVSFSNLRCLKVELCSSLSYLLTSSAAKRLGKLKRMEIKDCYSIEEIVYKETDEDEIIFPQLTCLDLDSLRMLKRFYRGSLGFPSLKELLVTYCNEMITLCEGSIEAANLSQVIDKYSDDIPLETDLNSTMRKKYLTKISELDELDLESRPRLQEIWNGSLHIPDLCFSMLAKLTVNDCQFLSDAVLPFHLLPLLPKLDILEVRNCNYVKVIFDVNASTQYSLITLPLKKLVLSNLPNVENVWNEDPRGILSMQHLEQVFVDKCKCLKSVFPASVARDLVKLEDLVLEDCEALMAFVAQDSKEEEELVEDEIIFSQLIYLKVESCNNLPYLFRSSTAKCLGKLKSMNIIECKSIEEIISKEGEESDENVEIKFEQLQDLYLEKLDKLRCFYDGNFTLRFPSLKKVHVIECSSMKTFSAFNKIDNPTWWYYSEHARPRKETDLNSALHKTCEEEAPDASTTSNT